MTSTHTNTVKVPAGLVGALEDRGVFAADEFKGRFAITIKGRRAEITGELRDLAELGDYVWQLGEMVRERMVFAYEVGYGAAELDKFAKRFPHKSDVPADEPTAEPEPEPEAAQDEIPAELPHTPEHVVYRHERNQVHAFWAASADVARELADPNTPEDEFRALWRRDDVELVAVAVRHFKRDGCDFSGWIVTSTRDNIPSDDYPRKAEAMEALTRAVRFTFYGHEATAQDEAAPVEYVTPLKGGGEMVINDEGAERIADTVWSVSYSSADTTAGGLTRVRGTRTRYYGLFRTPAGHVFLSAVDEPPAQKDGGPRVKNLRAGDVIDDDEANRYHVTDAVVSGGGLALPLVLSAPQPTRDADGNVTALPLVVDYRVGRTCVFDVKGTRHAYYLTRKLAQSARFAAAALYLPTADEAGRNVAVFLPDAIHRRADEFAALLDRQNPFYEL